MEKIIKKFLSHYGYLFLFYFLVSFLIFLKLFFSKGSLSGGDWGFPATASQIKVFFDTLFHTWTRTGNIFGTRQLSSVVIFFIAPLLLFAKIGIGVPLLIKISLVLTFGLGAANFSLFARYIGLKPLSAFIGGFIFILTPVFFNYSLMGWLYVLLSLALMPLFSFLFLNAVDKRDFRYLILTAIVFTLAIQSQTIVWYSLILLALVLGYGISTKKFKLSIVYGLATIIGFILLNSFWLFILLAFPDQGVVGNDIVKSTISIGASEKLTLANIFRLWASLFNYQFEASFPKNLTIFSYALPFVAAFSFIQWKKFGRHIVYLILILAVPIIFYFGGQEFVAKLPFANLMRDVARFLVLANFALATLAAITIDYIFKMKFRWKYILIGVVLLSLFLGAWPFFSGSFFGKPKIQSDFRFRTKTWPAEYQELDSKLQNDDKSKRAIFFPLGGMVSTSYDKNFRGAYQEVQDIYAGFSPVAGVSAFSDRNTGGSASIINQINEAAKSQDANQLINVSSTAGVDYIIFRKDLDIFDWGDVEKLKFDQALRAEVAVGKAEIYYDKGPILAIKLKSTTPLISASGQNYPVVTYEQINPAKYRIEVKNISGNFNLNFNESYNSYWKLLSGSGFFAKVISSDNTHHITNDIGNGYEVKISDLRSSGVLSVDKNGNQNAIFYLLFWPERYVVLTELLSSATFLLLIYYIFYSRKRSNKKLQSD